MTTAKLLKSAAIPLAALCLAPLSCLAQGSPGVIYEVLTETPKSGMTDKFEQGVKDVDAYAQSHGDTNGTVTFEYQDGPHDGSLVVLVPFRWADEDHPPSYVAGLDRVAVKSVVPYLSSEQTGLIQLIPNLGNPPPANATPEKYYEVITLEIKPGKMGDFLAAVTQITTARRQQNPRASNPVLVYRELSGGDGNQITVAIGHPDYADFARAGKSNGEVLREAYGEEVAASVMSSLDNSIEREDDAVIQYRPDLSFNPSGHGQ